MGVLDIKLLRDLRHILGQALAIAVVIACGVATVVMSFGTISSLEMTRDAYYEQQRFADVFTYLKRAPESLARHIGKIPGVKRVDTRIVERATLDVAGMEEPILGRLISLPVRADEGLNKVILRKGRMPDPKRPDEVILNEPFADMHGLGPSSTIVATINGHKRRLDVVGVGLSPEYVYAIAPGTLMPDDKRFGIIWLGRAALAASFNLEGAFNSVTLTLLRAADSGVVIDALDALLKPYGGIGAYDRDDQISNAFISNELEQLRGVGEVIPPIFLAVAAFLLNVVITRIIATEREQIGLLKAFGYTNVAVGVHYLKLVLLITAVGILMGFGVGSWFGRAITEIYTDFFRFPIFYFHLDARVFAAAGLVSLAASVIGAIGAIRGCVKLTPATAMQPAPPTNYRRGVLSTLGLAKRLSQPSLMILRHIGRWPLRAGLTTLGISMSVAILVGSLFFFDAIEYMIDTYFHRGQRQDATIVFTNPMDIRALSEMRRMPGVQTLEPYRVVAAKFHLGRKSKRVGIIGMDRETVLRRVLNTELLAVDLPEAGLVLSVKMAEMIGAVRGDHITVETLEGRRRTARVPVTAIVDEYIAAPAYMERTALNRLMGEGRLISGAYLQVDAAHEAELYRLLKDTPAVAGVTLQSSALLVFRQTMAETLDIMLSFYILFGGLIAVGVVYNSARVSLSERGRELASLRVLGFTRGEVSYVLLGELAILTLAALPLGCVLGLGLAHLMAENLNSELFRIPMFIDPSTYAAAITTVIVSAAVSGLIVRRRIDTFDLVGVLKTRE